MVRFLMSRWYSPLVSRCYAHFREDLMMYAINEMSHGALSHLAYKLCLSQRDRTDEVVVFGLTRLN